MNRKTANLLDFVSLSRVYSPGSQLLIGDLILCRITTITPTSENTEPRSDVGKTA